MFVAVGRLSFHLAGNSSLKGKRSIVRKMIEKSKARFNASVSEVASNDEHRHAVIGISVVGNSARHVDGQLAKVCSFIIRMGLAELVSHRTEVISLGQNFGDDRYFSALDELHDDFHNDLEDEFEDLDG